MDIPDFTQAEAFDDPWDAYRWLRHNDPIHWHDGAQAWFVTRHEDIAHISRTPELYCSRHGVRPVPSAASILTMDDPEHQQQRRLVARGFTARQVNRLEPHIREVTDRIITDVQARGEIEFVDEFAVHVPLIVIAELIGLDPEMRPSLLRWSNAIQAGEGRGQDDEQGRAGMAALMEYHQYVMRLIEERRESPREDLVSILTGAFDEGALDTSSTVTATRRDGMLGSDLFTFLMVLMVAGNETTRTAIIGGLHAFSLFPAEREKLVADPSLIDGAVDEILRWTSPVFGFGRRVTADHELHGKRLHEGDFVLLLYPSGNHDETVFADPSTFRIDRHPNPHLTFGVGPHHCLGANLARLEIRIVFEELFRRLPDIRVPAGITPERAQHALLLTLTRLPAVFTPVG